jgi:heterodisulfide reductase subunit B
MEDFIEALGGKVVESPFKIECCGSYHTVNDIRPVVERTKMIIDDSSTLGADAIIVGCPLCFFNLDYRQKNVEMRYRGVTKMPVLYFTQLLAIALGLDDNVCDFELNYVNPRPLLEEKGLIVTGK